MKPLPARPFSGLLTLVLAATLAGCGGADSNTATTITRADFPTSLATLADPNVVAINVQSGPGRNVNIPYVSVTVCTAGGVVGSSACKTIDKVLLDTGSTGLRLFASQLSAAPALSLPAQRIGASSTISECAQFLNALAWGSIKVADVALGGMRAASVPVQLMDSGYPGALTSVCGTSPVMAETSSTAANLQALNANGILGVSLFANDGQHYFRCTNSVVCRITAAASQQVQNPVALFSADNNGVVVQLPALDAAGVGSANGFLIFGVGTRSNNLLGTANVVPVNARGFFTTTFHGAQLDTSFMDSGSNGLFFNDPFANSTLSTNCSTAAAGFYCPATTQNLTAGIALASGNAVVNFSIANADVLFQANNYAFNNLGGTLDSTSFDWGLPFFFGRSVYTVIEGRSVGALSGPFYAFTN